MKSPAVIEVRFFLQISARDVLRYYRGEASMVAVTAEDGTRVRFPASNLRPFLTHAGVHGRFALRFDTEHKLVELRRIG